MIQDKFTTDICADESDEDVFEISDAESGKSDCSSDDNNDLPQMETQGPVPLSMGLGQVWLNLCISAAYANNTQSEILKNGVIVSGKQRYKILIDEIREHLMVPEYPETKPSDERKQPVGILHFIYLKETPVKKENKEANDPTTSEINDAFHSIVSEVCYLQSVRCA